MRLMPIFILETHNQKNNKCLPKFVQTDNPSSSIKAATGSEPAIDESIVYWKNQMASRDEKVVLECRVSSYL